MATHEDLIVYQRSLDLVVAIYQLTRSFLENEKFGLTNQMRRASVSIPSNIAEGAGRQTQKEFIHFLYVANGSINELETQLLIAKKLNYMIDITAIHSDIIQIKKMLASLIKSCKAKITEE